MYASLECKPRLPVLHMFSRQLIQTMADGNLIQFEKESSLEKAIKVYLIIFIQKYEFIYF